MEVAITNRPCILLETVELFYAYVNQIPISELTADSECSIPASQWRKSWTTSAAIWNGKIQNCSSISSGSLCRMVLGCIPALPGIWHAILWIFPARIWKAVWILCAVAGPSFRLGESILPESVPIP